MSPWAVREPDRVVRMTNDSVFDMRTRAGGQPSGFAQAELDYFAAHATTISGAMTIGRRVSVRVGEADVEASWVGGSYFTVLGADMAAGRGFAADEDRVDRPTAVAVLGHGFWQRQFAGDPAIIGRQIRLETPFRSASPGPRSWERQPTASILDFDRVVRAVTNAVAPWPAALFT